MTRTKPRSPFGDLLREQLEQTGISIRQLSRLLAEGDIHTEAKRRLLTKYIAGEVVPSEHARREIAAALGIDAVVFAESAEQSAIERRLHQALLPLAAELTRLAIEASRKGDGR